MRDLEDEHGVALFDHEATAVRLTEAGRVLSSISRLLVAGERPGLELQKPILAPPSTGSTTPVIKRAAGEHKKVAARPTSFGVP